MQTEKLKELYDDSFKNGIARKKLSICVAPTGLIFPIIFLTILCVSIIYILKLFNFFLISKQNRNNQTDANPY